jgi:signal transduction histidine kinase
VTAFRGLMSSVRLRLTLWNVLVLALVLLITGALLRHGVENSLMQTVDAELIGRAHGLQDRWPPPPDPDGRLSGRRFEAVGADEPYRPRILDTAGRNYRSHTPEFVLRPDDVKRSLSTDEQILVTGTVGNGHEPARILTVPLHRKDGTADAVLQTAAPLSTALRELDVLTANFLGLLPISLLFAGLGAAFLTDRSLRPVRAVTRAAAGIGAAEDLSARLVVEGSDEFSHLAGTFNGMVARLEAAFRDLEAAYDQQRRFVADASHELRTPLTIIKANTSLALSDPALDPDARDVLGEIDRAADRTSRIVQDLFLLARSDSGQLPIVREPIPVGVLLTDVAEQCRYLPGKGDGPSAAIRVELSAAPADLSILGDRGPLERLLTNLIENALRHTPSDGAITLSARPESGAPSSVLISVADTGEGIPPEHLARVMERFYRVDAGRARTEGGTGLGLAISAAIAEAHGGALTLDSEPGRGATARVTLPRA